MTTQSERLDNIEGKLSELSANLSDMRASHDTDHQMMMDALHNLHSKIDSIVAVAQQVRSEVEPLVTQVRTKGVMSLLTGRR